MALFRYNPKLALATIFSIIFAILFILGLIFLLTAFFISDLELLLATLFFWIMAFAVFFPWGPLIFYKDERKKKINIWLKNTQQPITYDSFKIVTGDTVDFSGPAKSVEFTFNVNGKNKYFYSDDIFYDPTQSITKDNVKFYFNPEDTSQYFIEIANLPAIA